MPGGVDLLPFLADLASSELFIAGDQSLPAFAEWLRSVSDRMPLLTGFNPRREEEMVMAALDGLSFPMFYSVQKLQTHHAPSAWLIWLWPGANADPTQSGTVWLCYAGRTWKPVVDVVIQR